MSWSKRAATRQLKQYMGAVRELRKVNPHMRLAPTIDEWLLDKGRLMTKRTEMPEEWVQAHTRECYRRAYKLFAAVEGLHYCEGNVQMNSCPIPVMHGWCVDNYDQVWDPSIEQDDPAVYWGVQFEREFVKRRYRQLRRRGAVGLVANAYLFLRKDPEWLNAAVVKR